MAGDGHKDVGSKSIRCNAGNYARVILMAKYICAFYCGIMCGKTKRVVSVATQTFF